MPRGLSLSLILLAVALILTGCGGDTPTQTPVVIVVTATPEPVTATHVPPTPVPPTVQPTNALPDETATTVAWLQAHATSVAIAQATQRVQDAATGTAYVLHPPATATPAPPSATPAPPREIAIVALKKGFHEADYLAGDAGDTITTEITFANHLGKDVRAFKGYITFSDLFGEQIMKVTLNISEPIKAGKTLKWPGEIQYNQFLDYHRKLKEISGEDLQYKFTLTDVIYADGTRESFGGGVQ
jgi:hypothetical protein